MSTLNDRRFRYEPETQCLTWLGSTASRKPTARYKGKARKLHRVFWELCRGPIGDDLFVYHLCSNGLCLNPHHMYLATATEHYLFTRECPHSSPWFGPVAKFSEEDAVGLVTRFDHERKAVKAPKFDVNEQTGCHEWLRPNALGYGTLLHRGKVRKAHRVFWELRHGPIPDGLHVLHECDNRRCVNVEHLFLGTHLDNMRDMVAKGRHGRRSQLTWDDIEALRERHANGESRAVLCREFGLGASQVSKIVNHKAWVVRRPDDETVAV